MEPEKNISHFHIGMRNVKTALAAFIVLALFEWTERGNAMLALVAAIICMQDSVENSVSSGVNRMLGTFIGALVGIAFFFISNLAPGFDTLFTPLAIIVVIWLLNVIRRPNSVVIACVVVLAILLQQFDHEPFIYSLNRLLDTLCGTVVAILVNRFVNNPFRKKN